MKNILSATQFLKLHFQTIQELFFFNHEQHSDSTHAPARSVISWSPRAIGDKHTCERWFIFYPLIRPSLSLVVLLWWSLILSSGWMFGRIFSLEEWWGIGSGCQGGGGVSVPGNGQETWRYVTWGHGLLGMVEINWQLNLILEVFHNCSDSMILRNAVVDYNGWHIFTNLSFLLGSQEK